MPFGCIFLCLFVCLVICLFVFLIINHGDRVIMTIGRLDIKVDI